MPRPCSADFIEEVAIEPGEFQIPPNEIGDLLPQQLIMLKTALHALRNAGIALREPKERMGAVIGISFDYEATNFHQRWCFAPTPGSVRYAGLGHNEVNAQVPMAGPGPG